MEHRAKQEGKIYVGLSGGVDSSVSAALLQKAEFDVTGVFIKIWSPEWTECTSKEDRLDAMRVCAHLKIPFKEIDLTKEYKREVVDYMIREYATGRSPNQDAVYNRSIKLGTFFKWVLENPPAGGEADFVATGHYSQIKKQKSKIKNTKDIYTLTTSVDSDKDQSYFLWTLTQGQLKKILFPIGHLKKSEVRALARKFKLPTAEKKDSQGLCFVGHVDIKEFLSRYVPKKRGDVLNEQGKIIGYHDGAHLLTIGERHGFTLNADSRRHNADRRGNIAPYYVVAKDIKRNTVTVSPKKNLFDISNKSVKLSLSNWIQTAPDPSKTYEAQIRYHGKRYRCRINENIVEFIDKPEALASGQSLVAYDKETCLGGGVMEKVM